MSLLLGEKEIAQIKAAAKSIVDDATADAEARIRAIVADLFSEYTIKITFEKKENS